MKSIKEVARDLINKKNDFISYDEIIKELDVNDIPKKDIKAIIYTDLVSTSEFFYKDDQFNLTKNFTMHEISKLKSEYAITNIVEDEEIEDIDPNDIIIDEEYEDKKVDVEDLVESNMDFIEVEND